MAEKRSGSDQPSEPVNPDPVDDLESDGPRRYPQAVGPSFIDRLDFGGWTNPLLLRYSGPEDYCGFEIPTPEKAEDSRFEGSLNLSIVLFSGDPVEVNLEFGQPVRDQEESVAGAALPMPHGGRGGGVNTDPRSGSVWPAGHSESPTSYHELPKIPGYEVLGELGRGGMGVVYKARQLSVNRVAALKMILPGAYAGPDEVERFGTEAEIVSRLRHPNIVRIHAIGDFEGRPYVELEYVEGGSLESRLIGKPWPPREAAALVKPLAEAMSEAHQMGIVHRDIKPGNILLTGDGIPKITDFGLAESINADSGPTLSPSILGSPNYMSPEQADGRTKEIGPASDLYALGATLYELLTGRPPFLGPTIPATLELVKNAEPIPPTRLQPGVTPDLETICLKCLKKPVQERYESADALAEDLHRFLAGEPILARPAPDRQRTSSTAG